MEQWLGAVWQRGGIRDLHRGRFTNVEDNPPPPPRHAEILSGVFTRFSWLFHAGLGRNRNTFQMKCYSVKGRAESAAFELPVLLDHPVHSNEIERDG